MGTQVSMVIPWDRTVTYSGITNAGWEQRCDMHIIWDGTVHTLMGKGEGVPTIPASATFQTGPQPNAKEKVCKVDVTCSFRRTPDSPWELSELQQTNTPAAGVTKYMINAEDGFKTGKDSDFNDLIVTIEWPT